MSDTNQEQTVQLVLGYTKPLAKVHPPIKLRFSIDGPLDKLKLYEFISRALFAVNASVTLADGGKDSWDVEIDFEPLEERWIELHNGKPVRMGP